MRAIQATKFEPRRGWLLTAALLLALTGCDAKQSAETDPSVDPFAPSAHDQAPDPVREARQRGWLSAQRGGATLVTDCIGMADGEERYGCATYVNNLNR